MYPKYIWKLILFITSTIYYTLPIECIVFIVSWNYSTQYLARINFDSLCARCGFTLKFPLKPSYFYANYKLLSTYRALLQGISLRWITFPSTGIQKQLYPGATLNILNPNSFHKIPLFCDSIEDKKLHTRCDVFTSN